MLEVNSTIKDNAIFSHRYFVLKGSERNTKIEFPISEKYRDLLHLIMVSHFIETQNTSINQIKLKTFYDEDFTQIKKEFEMLLGILTNRDVKILIEKKPQVGSQKTFELKNKSGGSILFSGGIDSICGSIKLLENMANYLVHIPSSKTVFGKMRKTLSNPAFTDTITYCINSRIKSKRDRTAISDTRGLLFLTAGYVMSKSLNQDKVYFCENGGQLLDVMLGNEVYVHSKATKNTNLRYLNIVNSFLESFDPGIEIVYPFKNQTKAELISHYITSELFESSWSCYNLRQSVQCGTCWNCFITKMSVVASDLDFNKDIFKIDPLLHTVDSDIFKSNQNIIYDLLVFYESIINENKKSMDIISFYSEYFEDPFDLARRFGLDVFLGVQKTIENSKNISGLGKKGQELLGKIDPNILLERYNELLKIRDNSRRN